MNSCNLFAYGDVQVPEDSVSLTGRKARLTPGYIYNSRTTRNQRKERLYHRRARHVLKDSNHESDDMIMKGTD